TISKILKRGEKYLSSDESGCSPVSIKRRRMADLRPALSSSAKREDHNNPRLKNAMILEKAQAFTSATNVPSQILTLGWVQRFSLQNDPADARSPERSGSINGPKSFPPADLSSRTAPTLPWTSPQAIVREREFDSQDASRHDHLRDKSQTSGAVVTSGYGQTYRHGVARTVEDTLSSSPHFPISHSAEWDTGATPGRFQYFPSEHTPMTLPVLASCKPSDPRERVDPLSETYATGKGAFRELPSMFVSPQMLILPSEEGPRPISGMVETIRTTEPIGRRCTVAPYNTPILSGSLAHQQEHETQREELLSQWPDSLSLPRGLQEVLRALETLSKYLQEQPHGFLEYEDRMHVEQLAKKLRVQLRASNK
ncbi:hypothetical protein LTR74_018137, partial [Friedmanniomyces endolithicus]